MPSSSKAQQRFFGVVKAMQKGDKPKDVEAGKVSKSMSKEDVDDFASTKHKGLPNKVKQETKVRSLIRKMVREIMAEEFGGNLKNSKKTKILFLFETDYGIIIPEIQKFVISKLRLSESLYRFRLNTWLARN